MAIGKGNNLLCPPLRANYFEKYLQFSRDAPYKEGNMARAGIPLNQSTDSTGGSIVSECRLKK